MLACSEGVKFISEDKLLKELNHAFVEIEAVSHLADPMRDLELITRTRTATERYSRQIEWKTPCHMDTST